MKIMTENQPHSSKSKSISHAPKQQCMPKRWLVAKQKFGNTRRQHDNEALELHFMNKLNSIKQLIKGKAPIVFERDYRKDNSDSALAMHGFMTDSIHLYLFCTFNFEYRIEYAFYNCPHEQAIRKLLNTFIFQGRTTEIALQPSFTEFFRNVQGYQHKRYIYSL
jgi:hypothetical protein